MSKKDKKPLAPVVESTTKKSDKDLTEQELLEKAQAISQRKRDEFVREYNAICEKYGMVIEPKIQLEVRQTKTN